MMRSRIFSSTMILYAAYLCAGDQADDYLRRGILAFHEADYATALRHFESALPQSTDPGEIAFLQGASLAALRQDAEAALAFERCLEDASGLRRVLALWGRGNALAQIGYRSRGKVAVAQLQLAQDCLELSLHEFQDMPLEKAPGRSHYLEQLSKNLAVVKTVKMQKEQEARSQPEDQPSPQRPKPETEPNPDGGSNPTPSPTSPESQSGSGDDQANKRPGRGQLPLLDDKNAAALTAEQAEDYLQQAMDRIQRQRGLASGDGIKPGARDW